MTTSTSTSTITPNLPAPTVPDTDDPKVAAVQRIYAAVATNDVEAILAELADDVEWAAEASSATLPWYGIFRGRDEVPGFFQGLGETRDIEFFIPLTYTWNDTDVMVPVHWAYTVKGTGRRAEMVMQHWWHFAGGKVVLFRGAEDTAQSVAAAQGS